MPVLRARTSSVSLSSALDHTVHATDAAHASHIGLAETHRLIRLRSLSFSSEAPSHVCSNSISSALNVSSFRAGGGGGSILPCALWAGSVLSVETPAACRGVRVDGEAGVKGDAGDGVGFDVDPRDVLAGMSGGMGRIQIRSRRRLCYCQRPLYLPARQYCTEGAKDTRDLGIRKAAIPDSRRGGVSSSTGPERSVISPACAPYVFLAATRKVKRDKVVRSSGAPCENPYSPARGPPPSDV